MARKFSELRAKMSDESRRRAHQKAETYRKEMALDELREALNLTQEHLAKTLGVKQSSISKMERRADMYVSTLESMVRAMGGALRIEAVFPDHGRCRLPSFESSGRAKRFRVQTAKKGSIRFSKKTSVGGLHHLQSKHSALRPTLDA